MTITGARLRLLLGPRTPPVVGPGASYDLTPQPLPGAFRQGMNVSGPESTYTVGNTLYTNPYPDMAC